MKTMRCPARLLCGLLILFLTCGVEAPERHHDPVINEFMAANVTSGITDESGDADDWIELCNTSGKPLQSGDYGLSDDSTRLYRYALPDTQLPPGGYLLIWADDEPEQGKWHAPFKLSATEGEEIILTHTEGRIVDRIQFYPRNRNPIARVPDESYGRFADGDTLWVQQDTPSPGAANAGGRAQPRP
jgi:hypothetical protein